MNSFQRSMIFMTEPPRSNVVSLQGVFFFGASPAHDVASSSQNRSFNVTPSVLQMAVQSLRLGL